MRCAVIFSLPGTSTCVCQPRLSCLTGENSSSPAMRWSMSSSGSLAPGVRQLMPTTASLRSIGVLGGGSS